MFELLADALRAMAGYPPVAAFGGLCVLAVGIWVMLRGERHRKSNGHSQPIPAWMLYGPAHDMMLSITRMEEENRKQTDLLERIESHTQSHVENSRQAVGILELIRNESRLR